MDLRFWGIIAIAGLIIMMVTFGSSNPVEEYRKQKELERKGKDPLVSAIEEYNAKSQGGMMNSIYGSGGSGSGGGTGLIPNFGSSEPDPNEPAPLPGSPGYVVKGTPGYIAPPPAQLEKPPEMPSYMMPPKPGNNPYLAAQPYYRPKDANGNPQGLNPPTPAPPLPPGQNSQELQDLHNGYYPPKPMIERPRQLSPHSHNNFYIHQDGAPKLIGFAGSHVYTYNEEGIPVPMPDGHYPVFNGQKNLMIYNGKRIHYSN